jgi:hypothetical protein
VKLSHSYSALKMFENCPLRYFKQRIEKSVVDKGGEASLYGERIHKLLEDALKGAAPGDEILAYVPILDTIRAKAEGAQILAEQEYTLNAQLVPTGWWDDDAWIRSKLDVLVLFEKRAVMFDYKTGKRRPDFNQLELFALQVFSHHPSIDIVSTGFIWLKDFSTDRETYHRSQMPALWQSLLARIRAVEKAAETNIWPAKPSGLCPYCPARKTCPHAR